MYGLATVVLLTHVISMPPSGCVMMNSSRDPHISTSITEFCKRTGQVIYVTRATRRFGCFSTVHSCTPRLLTTTKLTYSTCFTCISGTRSGSVLPTVMAEHRPVGRSLLPSGVKHLCSALGMSCVTSQNRLTHV